MLLKVLIILLFAAVGVLVMIWGCRARTNICRTGVGASASRMLVLA